MREIALEPMRVPEHADPRASREMGQPAFYEGSLLPGTKEVSLVTEYSTRFHRIEASHHIWIMCFHRIVPKSKWKSFMYRFVSYCLQLDRSRYPRHGGLNMVLRICLGQRLPRHGRYLQVPGKGVSEILQQTWVCPKPTSTWLLHLVWENGVPKYYYYNLITPRNRQHGRVPILQGRPR